MSSRGLTVILVAAVVLMAGCAVPPVGGAVPLSDTPGGVPPGVVVPGPEHPGALNPAVTQATIRQTICTHGWTATVRPRSRTCGRSRTTGWSAPATAATPRTRPRMRYLGLRSTGWILGHRPGDHSGGLTGSWTLSIRAPRALNQTCHERLRTRL